MVLIFAVISVSIPIILAAGMPVSFFVMTQLLLDDEGVDWKYRFMLLPWTVMISCIILGFNLYIIICGIIASPICIGLYIYEIYKDYRWAVIDYRNHVENFRLQAEADKTGFTLNRQRAQARIDEIIQNNLKLRR